MNNQSPSFTDLAFLTKLLREEFEASGAMTKAENRFQEEKHKKKTRNSFLKQAQECAEIVERVDKALEKG